MNLWTGIEPFIAALIGAICGSAAAPKLLGDWWLEKVKADYSKKLAEIEHKLSILLSDRQNSFWMGINSHMATVLFDKHVDFCEEYAKAMSKALSTFKMERSTCRWTQRNFSKSGKGGNYGFMTRSMLI
jgi:hypothetical protein